MTLPTVAPTSELPLAMNHLAESVANSPAFQALVGAADAAEARADIWIHTVPANSGSPKWPRPFALISNEQANRRLEAFDTMIPGARMLLLFEIDAPDGMKSPGTQGDAFYTVLNSTEQIITEIADQRNTAGRLAVTQIELQQILGGAFDEETEDGSYWQIAYQLGYDQ